MASLVPARSQALTRSDARRLDMFRKTVGKQLQGSEVDEAIEWCEIFQANPFTKDIYFFVFDANDEARRRVVPVLSIQLYRKIATRSGNYRPDEKPPRFTYDQGLAGPANPKGIVDCEVTVNQFLHGAWHPITEKIKWEERAPLKEDCAQGFKWEETGEVWEDSGKPKKKRVPKGDLILALDPKKENWHRMPETMLAKCVEAAAIRKGWPNETAGSYGEGDLDAAHTIELTATEIADEYDAARKLEMIGGKDALTVEWDVGSPLERVPAGQFCDKALEWASHKDRTSNEIKFWWKRNELPRAEFKAKHGSDYLEWQRSMEEKIGALVRAEAATEAA